ncbi:MAG: MFS transporter [Thalassobaculales bacterium]
MSDRTLPWPVILVGFISLAIAFSARAALGLSLPAWEAEGWSRTAVSSVGALALVVVAAVAPFAGAIADRRGPRDVLGLGMVVVAAGAAVTMLAPAIWVLAAGFGLVSAIGFGLVATHVVSTAVARAAGARKGLAIGIATSGATAGQFLLVPLLAAILASAGWRWTFAAVALAALALAPVAARLLPAGGGAARGPRTGLAADLAYLAASPVFQLLFWSFLICGYTTAGVIETHLIPYAILCGFPPVAGATAYGLLSAVNFAGMLGSGWLSDRMSRPLLLAILYLGRAGAFVVLMQIEAGYEVLIAFAIVFGVFDYSTVPPTASLVASHLGLRVMGLAMGLIAAGHAIGGAAGAFLGGYLYDLTGRYDLLWQSSLALAAAAGLMCLGIRPRPPAALPA